MPKRPSKPRTPIVRIFVSSTFRDMTVERDLLATRVFPRLERYLQEHGWVLEVIDLRWGIPKDAVDEGLVVEQCRRQIDDARPFFLGLIGSRYGTRVNQLGGAGAHSVTEDEIRHGVFRRKSDLKGSVFLLRSEESAERVPAKARGDYLDADASDRDDLRRLRRRIAECGARCAEYSAVWSRRDRALAPEDGFVQQAEELLREEMRLRLGIDDDAAVDPHSRLANAQRVAAIRAERRAYCPRSAASLLERTLDASPSGVVRVESSGLECPDLEFAHAAALTVLRLRGRRGHGALALDGRFWTGERSADAVLRFISAELHALGVVPDPRAPGEDSPRPLGFREQFESIARSVRRRTTLLVAFPELLVPAGYWKCSEWVPNLRKSRLRLMLVGATAQLPPRAALGVSGTGDVRAALVRVFAADGRALDDDLLDRAASCRGLDATAGRRLFAEVLRSAKSVHEVRERCASLFGLAHAVGPNGFAEHCLGQVLNELRSQLGERVVRGLLPFIATSRTGLLDSDCEALGAPKDGAGSIALARRLRRILDVSEGRLRIVGSGDRDRTRQGVSVSAEMLVRAGADLLHGSTLRQLHAEVASKFQRSRLEVGVRDFVWHAVESGRPELLDRAFRACVDPDHLARWARCAPCSEIVDDFSLLENAVRGLPRAAQMVPALRRWRDFVRGAFDRLRDTALDPWQTAHLEDLVTKAVAVRRTRFAALVSASHGTASLTAGRLGVIAEVARMRFERSGVELLVERASLLESYEPESGTLRIADSGMWRRATSALVLRRSLRRRKQGACSVGGITVETDLGEPIVHIGRGAKAIPVCADALAVRADGGVGAALRNESGILSCWRLADLAALPPIHERGVLEIRRASGDGRSGGASSLARSASAVETVTWGFDGQRIEHDRRGRVVGRRRASRSAIWRVTQSAEGLILAGRSGVFREHDGQQVVAGAVGDIAAHPDGTVLAVARESDLERIELVDLSPSAGAAAAIGHIMLPSGMRHGFRALHWIDPCRLLVGMMEPEGCTGQVGCWSIANRQWVWMNKFDDHAQVSLVMGLDLARTKAGVVAATLPLASKVLLLDHAAGNVIAELPIHDSNGMLHRVDFSPEGDRLTTTDRNGFFEIWRLQPDPMLEARVALPMGAFTAYLNLGASFVVATEGGRVMRLELKLRGSASRAEA
jgi:hypothetical protein